MQLHGSPNHNPDSASNDGVPFASFEVVGGGQHCRSVSVYRISIWNMANVRVGIGVLIFRGSDLLVGKRCDGCDDATMICT